MSWKTARCGPSPPPSTRQALYDRNPLMFWKVLSASLVILVAVLLAWR